MDNIDKITTTPYELSLDDQILVLISIDWESRNRGLCGKIATVIENILDLEEDTVDYDWVEIYIPSFTFENAIQFGAANKYYWWPFTEEGFAKRKEFVAWLLEELCKQVIN